MRRTFGIHIRLDEEAMCKLNRIRRGSRQPLSRFVNIIVNDFVDTVRVSSVAAGAGYGHRAAGGEHE
jgi:hypothetical protein